MRKDSFHQFFFGGLKTHGYDEALNHFRHLGAEQVRAQKLARSSVEDGLNETLIFPHRNGLSIRSERKTPYPNFVPRRLRPSLRQTDAGDLGATLCAGGYLAAIKRVREKSLYSLDAGDAFVLGLVGQHRRSRDVADGE
jgi:hypothetical protein